MNVIIHRYHSSDRMIVSIECLVLSWLGSYSKPMYYDSYLYYYIMSIYVSTTSLNLLILYTLLSYYNVSHMLSYIISYHIITYLICNLVDCN